MSPTKFENEQLDIFGARLLLAHMDDDPVGLRQLREKLVTDYSLTDEQVSLAEATARVYSMTYRSPEIRERARVVLTQILSTLL